MTYFEHDGIRFHYRTSGSGIPFVFQHGLGADANQVFELLGPPAGYQLISFDCRGHGETRPLGSEEGICIRQFTEDLRALLDYLKIERAVIGGISMGAEMALNFVLNNPTRAMGLVLSRPAWLDQARTDNKKVFSTIAEFIRKHGAWEGAKRYQETEAYQHVLKVSPDNANSLLSQFAHPRAEETVAKLERIPAHVPLNTREDWKRIRIPTLVIVNHQDAIHPFEFGETFAVTIPNAALVEVTPKSVNKDAHAADVQRAIELFLTQFRDLKA